MELFTINEEIKFIDNFYYCQFFANSDFYDDKFKSFVNTTDLLTIDKQLIRLDIYNNLSEMYPDFQNEYYL